MKLTELLTKLISYKTVSGNHTEVKKAFDFIKKYLGKSFYFKDFCFNGFNSLLISNTKELNNFDVVFNGHIDVVSADDKDFVTKTDNDKMYGRGTIDMKGQIACILHILKNTTLDKHVGVVITSDEELGGHNGAEKIVQEYPIKAKLVIVPDAGENFTFVDSEKALLQLDIVATGLSAHASTPNEGRNAILECIDIYSDLCKQYELDIYSPVNDNISINLSILNSGDLYNKVPALANMSLDIRYSGIKRKDLERNIDNICKKHNAVYNIHNAVNEFKCDLKNSEVVKFIKSCEKTLGKKLEHIKVNGASDIGYFASLNIPCVSINPEGYNLHSENEHIILSSLDKFQQMLIEYLIG